MDPDSIHKNENYPYPDFKIRLIFKNACHTESCYNKDVENHFFCPDCKTKLSQQLQEWEMIRAVVETRKKYKHNNF